MKKVLVVTYYWPPSGGAGVQRWLKFVKYMSCYGWEPIVYTPQNAEIPEIDFSLEKEIPKNIQVLKYPIWEPYSWYKRFTGQRQEERIRAGFLAEKAKPKLGEKISVWVRGNFFIPDARKFWVKPSIKYLKEYLNEHPVDAIITTGPPHSMHLIGMKLAKLFSLPWIADFRDPWTNIDFYKELHLTCWADDKHKKLEHRVLKNASSVIVVSKSMAEEFKTIFDRTYDVITNGYDESDFTKETKSLDEKFSLAHIGSIPRSRNPFCLWDALASLVNENQRLANDLEIKLVGKMDLSVIDYMKKVGLLKFVNKIDYLPHEEVIEKTKQSRVLLLLINNTPNAKAILTGKFFEYLAAKRPILCVGPINGDVAEIISETKVGEIADFYDIEKMKKVVLHYYEQYKLGKLDDVKSSHVEEYSRKELTKKLCNGMDKLV